MTTLRAMIQAGFGLILSAIMLSPVPAIASDGATEISQAAALQGGVTTTDGAGFPVTIDRPGSYVLTSNLEPPDDTRSAIRVLADDVYIDLNGFALIGPRTCSGSGTTISYTGPANSVSGIRGETASSVHVVNGTIRGFWRGLWLGSQCSVAEVISFNNSAGGFFCGSGAHLMHSIGSRNQGSGFVVGAQSVIREVVSTGNGLLGVNVVSDGKAIVERSVSGQNAESGILCSAGCSISRNVSSRNAIHGINAGTGSNVSANVAFENDGNELALGATTGYANNVLVDTRPGATAPVSGGVAVELNVCNGSVLPADCTTAPSP
jgi:hypothetical protein